MIGKVWHMSLEGGLSYSLEFMSSSHLKVLFLDKTRNFTTLSNKPRRLSAVAGQIIFRSVVSRRLLESLKNFTTRPIMNAQIICSNPTHYPLKHKQTQHSLRGGN